MSFLPLPAGGAASVGGGRYVSFCYHMNIDCILYCFTSRTFLQCHRRDTGPNMVPCVPKLLTKDLLLNASSSLTSVGGQKGPSHNVSKATNAAGIDVSAHTMHAKYLVEASPTRITRIQSKKKLSTNTTSLKPRLSEDIDTLQDGCDLVVSEHAAHRATSSARYFVASKEHSPFLSSILCRSPHDV